MTELISSARVLQECRSRIGSSPRKFPMWDRLLYLPLKCPSWFPRNDEIRMVFGRQRDLLRHGSLVWGHIVQANTALFQPGSWSAPGEVLYCSDSYADVSLHELQRLSSRIFQLKGTTPADPRELTIAEYLTAETVRAHGMPVAASLLESSRPFELTTVFFARHHLPRRKLIQPFFPLLISKDLPRVAMVLPAKYWPRQLLELWQE